MTDRRRLVVSRSGDLLVLALLVAAEIEIWLTLDENRWQAAIFAPLWTLPLLLRRRFTLAVCLLIPAVVGAESFVYEPATELNTIFIAVLANFVVLGLHEERVRAITAGIVGYAIVLFVLVNGGDSNGPSDFLFFAIFIFGPLAAGIAVRDRTVRTLHLQQRTRELEHAREEAAAAAAIEERARIARELHDVIAQSIGAMTVQAGAARTLLRTDPEQARRPIEAVEATGREALTETRRLLGILRDTNGPTFTPQPGLGLLDLLVDAARREDLDVDVSVKGEERPLSPGLDLAAYRIVQSGLAQASRHEGAHRAGVALHWRPDALEIVIDDDGQMAALQDEDSSVEMAALRERLALYNGSIELGCTEEGCCILRARLPLEAAA